MHVRHNGYMVVVEASSCSTCHTPGAFNAHQTGNAVMNPTALPVSCSSCCWRIFEEFWGAKARGWVHYLGQSKCTDSILSSKCMNMRQADVYMIKGRVRLRASVPANGHLRTVLHTGSKNK